MGYELPHRVLDKVADDCEKLWAAPEYVTLYWAR